MWRHAINGFMIVKGADKGYLIMGPLRAGGVLVEFGLILDTAATGECGYAMAITGSPSPTIENLRGGTSLLQRSNYTGPAFGAPTVRVQMSVSQHYLLALPLSVRLDTGGQYIIVGIWSESESYEVYAIAWALEVGGPGSGGNRRPMVDAGGLGVENGLDR